jgi:VCBS repeat-containing protein
MLWFYDKISEDENAAIYAYGRNSRETTGQFVYDKNTEKVKVLKVADNDTDSLAERATENIGHLIERGFPQKTHIQIG